MALRPLAKREGPNLPIDESAKALNSVIRDEYWDDPDIRAVAAFRANALARWNLATEAAEAEKRKL